MVPDVRQFCNSNGLNYGAINFGFIAFPAAAFESLLNRLQFSAVVLAFRVHALFFFFLSWEGRGKKLSFGKLEFLKKNL